MKTQREDHEWHDERLHLTDAELVHKARRGDEAAYDEMVDRFGPYLYRLAFSLVGNAADAEDVLQETFSGAFQSLRGFEERSSVRTWLAGILVRQAARAHRSRGRHRMISLGSISEAAKASRRAGSTTAALDARMDVAEVLQALVPIHREVIVLRELQGLSYEEMAGILGVPRGTVESRLFRAREELKERLKDYLP